MSTIGERVHLAREARNWAQSELASRMSVRDHKWSQATVWATEKGRRSLRLEEAVDLASILGVNLQWLATGKESEAGQFHAGYAAAVSEAREALDAFFRNASEAAA